MAGKRLQDVAASGFAKSSYAPSALCDLESKPVLQATGRRPAPPAAAANQPTTPSPSATAAAAASITPQQQQQQAQQQQQQAQQQQAPSTPSAAALPAGCRVLLSKALTRSDANAKRVILRCKQVESSLGSRPVGQGHRLAVGLPCGGSCQVMVRAWANGSNAKPMYVLEQQGCMQPACLGCMGCCLHKRQRVA
ncbi:hypothetical protein OEZ85_011241 [Tetradesmus obliquus]|uniref:Uncharacterized protein n=1 Tax=Tetradesmus obliquus TaxID=3088 RepID=A0ABY8TPP9_TETOB|nr:hypothetical protein OEZ85_011241 [Tetradesmus obliquus]